MDNTYILALRYQDLKHPTGRQNLGDRPGQTPKLILTLRPKYDRDDSFYYLKHHGCHQIPEQE